MASFNYYLRNNDDKAKPVTIYLYVTISRQERILLNTGIKVSPKYWNFKAKSFRSNEKRSPEKNAELQKLKAKIELAFIKHQALPFDELKVRLQNEISPVIQKSKGVPTVSEALEVFVADMKGIFSENYLRGYQQVINFVQGKKHFKQEADQSIKSVRDLPINKVGASYLKDYVQWMVHDGFQNATIKKHVKFLKKVLNVNADLFEIDGSHNKVRNIKLGAKKPFWLDHSEIKLLIDHQFRNKRMQQVADEWLFRYYTGLRDQDSNQILEHHIKLRGNSFYLDFNMIKNGRDFMLPLSQAAVDLLIKYEYALPKYSNQEKNRMIKLCFEEVGLDVPVEKVTNIGSQRVVQVLPKWQLVTTHSARRSFGRRWMDTVGDIEALSQYLGHSSSAITRSYIGWELEEYASFVKQLDFS